MSMKIKFNKPYFKSYRRICKNIQDQHKLFNRDDDCYSLWFNLLPVIEVNYFTYGSDHRYNTINLTLEWLFWGIEVDVNLDK